MTNEEFQQLLEQDPALAAPIREAVRTLPSQTMGMASPTEWAAIAAFFPVAVFIVRNIGLPWLHEASRYSELWRLKFHDWIDTQYKKQGFDPNQAEAFGEALREQLQATNDKAVRKAWERLCPLLKAAEDADRVQ